MTQSARSRLGRHEMSHNIRESFSVAGKACILQMASKRGGGYVSSGVDEALDNRQSAWSANFALIFRILHATAKPLRTRCQGHSSNDFASYKSQR